MLFLWLPGLPSITPFYDVIIEYFFFFAGYSNNLRTKQQKICIRKKHLQPLQSRSRSSTQVDRLDDAFSVINPNTGNPFLPPLIDEKFPESARDVNNARKRLQKFGLRSLSSKFTQSKMAGTQQNDLSCDIVGGIEVSSYVLPRSRNEGSQKIENVRTTNSHKTGLGRAITDVEDGLLVNSDIEVFGHSTKSGMKLAHKGTRLIRGSRGNGNLCTFNTCQVQHHRQSNRQKRNALSAPTYDHENKTICHDLCIAPFQPHSTTSDNSHPFGETLSPLNVSDVFTSAVVPYFPGEDPV